MPAGYYPANQFLPIFQARSWSVLDVEFDGDSATEDAHDICQSILQGKSCSTHPDADRSDHDPLSLRPARNRRYDYPRASIDLIWPLTRDERERYYPLAKRQAEAEQRIAAANEPYDGLTFNEELAARIAATPPPEPPTVNYRDFEDFHQRRERERREDEHQQLLASKEMAAWNAKVRKVARGHPLFDPSMGVTPAAWVTLGLDPPQNGRERPIDPTTRNIPETPPPQKNRRPA